MKMVSIEDGCVVVTDGTHYTPPNVGEGVPFLTVKDMSDQGLDFTGCSYITLDEYIKADLGNSSPKIGDVLFSKDGTVGKVHVVSEDQEFAVLSSIAILRPRLEVLDSQYFGHILRSSFTLDQAIRRKTGSAIRRIILKDLKQVQIPLPPLEEQRRIAAILDKADAVRRKRQSAIALTEELLRSAFLEMFGDPDTNPKGWEVVKIGDVANVGTGRTPSRDDPANFGGDIRWVKTTEVRNNIIEQTEEHLTEKGATQMTVFPENSILVAMYGQGITRGRTALLGCPCATNQACAVIFPDKQYCSIYLWTLLKLSYNRLRELGRGGNQPNLNLSMVKDFSIALPPLEKQARFRAFASTFHLESNRLIESQKFHNDLFNSLLQRAFRGEL